MQKKITALIFMVSLVLAMGVIAGCGRQKESPGVNPSVETGRQMITDTSDESKSQSDDLLAENLAEDSETQKASTDFSESNEFEVPESVTHIKGIEKFAEPLDYSNTDNWISLPDETSKPVDVLFLYPTVYGTATEVEDDLADVDDIAMRIGAIFAGATQASVFEESCNVYIPAYRQLTVASLLDLIDNNPDGMSYIASHDLYRMLDYYFEMLNEGRPFILAGHSQGSVWLTVILQEYMKEHPEYLENMIAAYAIGYSVTEDYLAANPHLKFAQGADDTGVIISYNTEGPGNQGQYNCVVREGAVAINPINWKLDDTYASAEENLGALGMDGEILENYADAKLDLERGVVICETVQNEQQMQESLRPYFGPESFHLQDYTLYYMNLRQNVADRIQAFSEK